MKYLTGSCLCRKVKLQVPDEFQLMGNCHCSECRKFSGSAFATAGVIDFDDLKITEGQEHISYYHKTADTDLGFCRHCGSSLFSKKLKTRKYNLRLGILDDCPTQRPTFHIYVGSKAGWYEITDELAAYEGRPPAP